MKISLIDKSAHLIYRVEDRIVRHLERIPRTGRVDSTPFLSSDTFFFHCDVRIDCLEDLEKVRVTSENKIMYVNGRIMHENWNEINSWIKKQNNRNRYIIVGDSDTSLDSSQISLLSQFFKRGWIVNLRIPHEDNIFPLPLGLESQRFRSAGQLRDFQELPNWNVDQRGIGILIAWNDATNTHKRSLARSVIRESQHAIEIPKRVNARYLHRLMRKTLLIPCPAGNGFDTHRFWESLYLGALPVIVKEDYIPAYRNWPHVAFEDWSELQFLTRYEIEKIYCENQSALSRILSKSKLFIEDLKRELV